MAVSWCLVALLATVVTAVAGEVDKQYGLIHTLPGESCRDIYQKNPTSHGKSGYYAIKVNNRPSFVYCDMELECGGEKGWMKVTGIDAAKTDCPQGWSKITSPVAACRAPSDNAGCYSAQFSTQRVPYSRVCGMVIGYQKGGTDGFANFLYSARSINGPYVDGVSITYGTPRIHIWTYGMGHTKKTSYLPEYPSNCPCSRYPGRLPPSFVRDDYYCEAGALNGPTKGHQYVTSELVWDGKGCPDENSCCSFANLPWFFKQIPLISDKNLEARICRDESFSNEGVLVKEIKLYVQ
ncbi:uncharacterized protein [Dysidea avara]|uniref:uncharacterized protein n=1 Tax=Dysidea avara TaxID=196820 RepID=UPI003316C12B